MKISATLPSRHNGVTQHRSSACGLAAREGAEFTPPDFTRLTLDDILALPGNLGYSKHPHKDVFTLPGPTPIYIKRQWAWDRRLPRWSDWRDGVWRDPDPVRGWDGLQRMRDIGLNVPTPLRLWRDDSAGSARSAIAMSAVPVSQSLAELIRSGEIAALHPLARRSLVVAIAEMAATLKVHRLRWKSMKAKHLHPQRLPSGDWQLWLIDCEGVRPQATRRQHRRDYETLLRSVRSAGADSAFLSALQTALR